MKSPKKKYILKPQKQTFLDISREYTNSNALG